MFRTSASAPASTLLFLLLLLLSLLSLASAQEIYRDSGRYAYQGCITETTDIANSSRPRALPGSALVDEQGMTVPMCLDFCASGGETGTRQYRYAGLQYSRECWCAQLVSDLSRTVDDGQCDLACAGDADTICGGNMRITLYAVSGAAAAAWTPLLVTLGVAVAVSVHLL
ncbi:WSC-domain-containing protein [Sodiomyces alkalinus F11]|uniref:WSC-domain-containing protein n=1 Tax=Sodiomyces alkalinus (strain CBS 110278 / VKM F-3762 / F11) TaxID=1314773 RepID=A0A3N2PQL6_SODAK|nr:WSC-domain-containing protein [Sodiomyces alkalinus F11]ROT36803.1 WSC-domain-containing protein [Sodiomyces alkalinus F11]